MDFRRILHVFVKVDRFLLALTGTVALATVLPVHGRAIAPAELFADVAVGLLFFLHGAKLSRQAILGGIGAWRIHLSVAIATFVMFPLLGMVARNVTDLWLNPTIGAGLLLLCLMPSTVQSSIALTAMARGNIPAAVCSASASTILGVFLTPMLAGLLLSSKMNGALTDNVGAVVTQLLLPFVAGHLARPLLQSVLDRYKTLLSTVDRSVILIIVYTAFSSAVVEGIWSRYALVDLIWTAIFCVIILCAAIALTTMAARVMKLSKEDEIVLVFCGSKKSLVSGVPIATALFPAALVGPLVVPLMLFHQIQLMAVTLLAQRYRDRLDNAARLADPQTAT